MSLTKKDFIKVADILNKRYNVICNAPTDTAGIKYGEFMKITEDFINWFKSENPNFDETKFREAVLK